jgi:hypothetical protein
MAGWRLPENPQEEIGCHEKAHKKEIHGKHGLRAVA